MRHAALSIPLVLLLLGCGSGLRRLPISGEVTFKGEPLEHGSIQFLTTEGPPGPAAGALIDGGRYQIPAVHGLEPGTYRVLISCAVEVKKLPPGWKGSPPTEELIPPAYSSFKESKVTIEVTSSGPNQFDFHID